MSLRISTTPEFDKEVKRLAKKYPKLSLDLKTLQELLRQDPRGGVHLGNNCYKLRLPNTSTKSGKSGGFRVISVFFEADDVVRLLSIYSKTERSSITDDEIKKILKKNELL